MSAVPGAVDGAERLRPSRTQKGQWPPRLEPAHLSLRRKPEVLRRDFGRHVRHGEAKETAENAVSLCGHPIGPPRRREEIGVCAVRRCRLLRALSTDK